MFFIAIKIWIKEIDLTEYKIIQKAIRILLEKKMPIVMIINKLLENLYPSRYIEHNNPMKTKFSLILIIH